MNNFESKITNNQYLSFSVEDILEIFIKYKRKIIIITLTVGLLIGLFLFFVANPIFLSSGVVKTTSKMGGLSSMITQNITDLGDLGDLTGGGSAGKELALYENILTSRRCLEEAIIKFKLNDEWEYKFMQDAVKNFREEVLTVSKDKTAGTMEIGIFDKDPQRAKEMVEFLIYQLNKINTELNVTNAKANREYIEQRYYLIRQDLRGFEDSLRQYQDVYGIAPDLKAKAIIQSVVQLEAEEKSEEIKLDLMNKILSPGESEILIQKEKIASLKSEIRKINESGDSSLSFHLKGAPGVILNYLRLVREVEIQNKMLIYIMPLYEQAKIEEKKETPSVLVLDQPVVPERKAKPKRVVTILLFMFVAFTISLSVFIVYTKWKIFINNFQSGRVNIEKR
jgi:tyrosine-protein kinase Etk/Wzc